MYTITKEDWDKIPEDFRTTNPDGTRCTFQCFLTPDGSGGEMMCYEHIHFEITGEDDEEDVWE